MRARYLTPLVAACLLGSGCGDDAAKQADTTTSTAVAAPPTTTTAPAPTTGAPTTSAPSTSAPKTSAPPTSAPSTSSGGPRATVLDYFTALAARDGEKACGLLTVDARRKAVQLVAAAENASFKSCGLALKAVVADRSDASLRAGKVKIKSSTVNGNRAKVVVERGAADIVLTKRAGRWFIADGFG